MLLLGLGRNGQQCHREVAKEHPASAGDVAEFHGKSLGGRCQLRLQDEHGRRLCGDASQPQRFAKLVGPLLLEPLQYHQQVQVGRGPQAALRAAAEQHHAAEVILKAVLGRLDEIGKHACSTGGGISATVARGAESIAMRHLLDGRFAAFLTVLLPPERHTAGNGPNSCRGPRLCQLPLNCRCGDECVADAHTAVNAADDARQACTARHSWPCGQ